MNSINENQEERNFDNLQHQDAIEKIKELTKKAETCFFSTAKSTEGSNGTRPMSVLETDDQGNLWFLCANDSHVYSEIKFEPFVKLYFQGSAHSDFLYLEGHASLSRDQDKIEELWNPMVKNWFTEGKDDPRIAVIKYEPKSGYYWDNKHGNFVAGVKMMIGAISGKTMDDSIEGELKV